jgi:hypothetical protein
MTTVDQQRADAFAGQMLAALNNRRCPDVTCHLQRGECWSGRLCSDEVSCGQCQQQQCCRDPSPGTASDHHCAPVHGPIRIFT